MTGGGTGDVLGAEVQGGHFIYVFFNSFPTECLILAAYC